MEDAGKFLATAAAIVLALLFAFRPAAAADPVTDWIKELELDCRVPRVPSVVVVGLASNQTVLSDVEAEAVRAEVEILLQDTGRVTVVSGADVTRLKALQEGTTGLSAAAAEDQIRAAFTGDAVIFVVEPARVDGQATLRLQAINKAATCKVQSPPISVPIPATGPENVDALLREAVRNLVQSAPDVKTVAVCPFKTTNGESACSDQLTDKLMVALDRESRSPDRVMQDRALEARRLSPGDACTGSPGLVTSHGNFMHASGKSWLELSFERGRATLAPTGLRLVDMASMPCDPAIKAFLDHIATTTLTDPNRIDVTPAESSFTKGDRLEIKIVLKAQQNLYCWLLDSDESAYVALPVQGQPNSAAPIAGTKRYPFDFGLGEMVAGAPLDNLFDCFSVAGEIPADLQARWLAAAPSAGADAKLLQPDDVRDLLDKFRHVKGVAEAAARLVVR